MTASEQTMVDTFESIELLGPAQFLEKLVPVHLAETEYLNFTATNARNYLLLRALTEVQRVGFVSHRIRVAATDGLRAEGAGSPGDLQILETLVDEQSLWHRKLLEIIVLLVLFSGTNELPYYYHYLLALERRRYENELREQRDFFSATSQLTKATVRHLEQKLDCVLPSLDRSKVWYLEPGGTANRTTRKLRSFRQRLLLALPSMIQSERTAVGYTYGVSYAETSANIHFDPCRLDYTDLLKVFHLGRIQCGALTCAILARAHSLADIEPTGINVSVLSRRTTETTSGDSPMAGKANVGDFVLVNGPYLAEVLEAERNAFGYERYRVQYLAECPFPEIREDWIPAFRTNLFVGKAGLEQSVKEILIRDAGVDPAVVDSLDLGEAGRQGVLEGWNLVFREYARRTAQPWKKGDKGIGYQD